LANLWQAEDGKLKFDALKLEDEPCKYVLETNFRLAESQMLKPKVLFDSSGIFSEFLSAWRKVSLRFYVIGIQAPRCSITSEAITKLEISNGLMRL
jgi:hypothetical protein